MAGIADAPGVAWRASDYHDHILTDFYLDVLVDARNNVTALLDMIGTVQKNDVGGKFIIWPVHTGRNVQGGNYMDARGFLPDPTSQQYDNQTQIVSDFYFRIKLDGKTMRQAQSNRSAYVDAVDTEVQGALIDAKILWQQAIVNDGSGRLAEVKTDVGSGVLELRLHSGIVDNDNCDSAPTRFIRVDDRLGFATTAGGSVVVLFVVSVDSDTNITVSLTSGGAGDATGVIVNDWVVRASREGGTSILDLDYRSAVTGIEGWFDDRGVLDGNGAASGQTGSYDITTTTEAAATFQGLPATAAFAFNQAIVEDGSGTPRDISDTLLQNAFSNAEEQNNAMIGAMISSYPTYNAYITTLTEDRRFNNTIEFHGGHKTLDFNGVPFFKEKDVYKNRVYIMDMGQVGKVEVEPLNWLDMDGSIWNRIPNKDEWEAAFHESCNYIVEVRERLGAVVTDLNA